MLQRVRTAYFCYPYYFSPFKYYNILLILLFFSDLEHRRAVLNGEESASSDDGPVDNGDDGSDFSSEDELLHERTSAVRNMQPCTATGSNRTVGSSRPSSSS